MNRLMLPVPGQSSASSGNGGLSAKEQQIIAMNPDLKPFYVPGTAETMKESFSTSILTHDEAFVRRMGGSTMHQTRLAPNDLNPTFQFERTDADSSLRLNSNPIPNVGATYSSGRDGTRVHDPSVITMQSANEALQQFVGRKEGYVTPNPTDLYSFESYDMPAAYKGPSQQLSRLIMHLVTEDQWWLLSTLCPIRNVNHIGPMVLDVFEYDHGIMHSTPYETTSRMMGSTRTRSKANQLRWGGAAQTERNFFLTSQGHDDFARKIIQQVTAIKTTLALNVITEFLNCDRGPLTLRERTSTPLTENGFKKMRRDEVENFAIIHKQKHGYQKLVDYIHDVMKKRGVAVNSLIALVPDGQTRYIASRSEKSEFKETGVPRTVAPNPEELVIPGLSSVRPIPPIHVASRESEPLEPMVVAHAIGGYFTFDWRGQSFGQDFRTDHQNLRGAFMPHEQPMPLSIRQFFENTGLYQRERGPRSVGKLTPNIGHSALFNYELYESEMSTDVDDPTLPATARRTASVLAVRDGIVNHGGKSHFAGWKLRRFAAPGESSAHALTLRSFKGVDPSAFGLQAFQYKVGAASDELQAANWTHTVDSFYSFHAKREYEQILSNMLGKFEANRGLWAEFVLKMRPSEVVFNGRGFEAPGATPPNTDAGKALLKLALQKFSLATSAWWDFCFDNDIPTLMSGFTFVPLRTLSTGTNVFALPGEQTAFTAMGNLDMTVGQNYGTKMIGLQTTFTGRAWVHTPENVIVQPAVQLLGYLGGDDNIYYDHTEEDYALSRQHMPTTKSQYAVWCPPSFVHSGEEMDITGKFSGAYVLPNQAESASGNESKSGRPDLHYPTADLYASAFGWITGPAYARDALAQYGWNAMTNTICYQTWQLSYDPLIKVKQTLNQGHLGRNYNPYSGIARPNPDLERPWMMTENNTAGIRTFS